MQINFKKRALYYFIRTENIWQKFDNLFIKFKAPKDLVITETGCDIKMNFHERILMPCLWGQKTELVSHKNNGDSRVYSCVP